MTDTYIALDLETTGLNPSTDRILEKYLRKAGRDL